jgi:hypothetical protein
MNDIDNTNGVFIQLVSQEVEDMVISNSRQNMSAVSVGVLDITDNLNNYRIQSRSDLIEIDKLALKFNENEHFNINEILNQLKTNLNQNNKFVLFSGGEDIISIDLHFAVNLSEPIIVNNNTLIINLCMNNYITPLNLIGTKYNSQHIRLELSDVIRNNLESAKIFVKNIFHEIQERLRLANLSYQTLIQQIGTDTYTNEEPFIHFNKNIGCNGFSKGFFISGNVSKITQFILALNGEKLITYDHILLQVYAKQFGQNLLYIPFNTNFNSPFDDLTHNGLTGGLNFSRIGQIHLIINWSEPQTSFKIYNVTSNILRTMSGMNCLASPNDILIDLNHIPKSKSKSIRVSHPI